MTPALEALRTGVAPVVAAFEPYNQYEHLDVAYVVEGVALMYLAWAAATLVCSVTPVFKNAPMYAAYCFVGMVPICMLTYEGLMSFHEPTPETVEGRTYDFYDASARICMIQIIYQVFGIGVAFIAQGTLLSTIMIVHHVCTLTLGFINLNPFVHYHIIFFGGVIELSNIPLSVMDIFKSFPELQDIAPALNNICRYLFAIFFLVLRVALWLTYGLRFHLDCIELLRTGTAHSNATVVINQVLNLILTAMQLLWASKVVKSLLKALGLTSSKKKSV